MGNIIGSFFTLFVPCILIFRICDQWLEWLDEPQAFADQPSQIHA